jgi:hypothetical protein
MYLLDSTDALLALTPQQAVLPNGPVPVLIASETFATPCV